MKKLVRPTEMLEVAGRKQLQIDNPLARLSELGEILGLFLMQKGIAQEAFLEKLVGDALRKRKVVCITEEQFIPLAAYGSASAYRDRRIDRIVRDIFGTVDLDNEGKLKKILSEIARIYTGISEDRVGIVSEERIRAQKPNAHEIRLYCAAFGEELVFDIADIVRVGRFQRGLLKVSGTQKEGTISIHISSVLPFNEPFKQDSERPWTSVSRAGEQTIVSEVCRLTGEACEKFRLQRIAVTVGMQPGTRKDIAPLLPVESHQYLSSEQFLILGGNRSIIVADIGGVKFKLLES